MKLKLLIPAGHPGNVQINGNKAVPDIPVRIYHDDYFCFVFESSERDTIRLDRAADFTVPVLLQGEFDAVLKTSGDYAETVYRQYSLDLCEPREADFTLSPRRTKLNSAFGWEKQGQIFYSGEAVIRFGTVSIQSGDRLELPGFRDIAELMVDGVVSARSALTPYRFDLPAGTHELSLRIWNRMANRLERYAAPSGLTQPPVITE